MQYRGYTYYEDIQEEDDNRKIFHEIIDPEGKRVDWHMIPRAFHQISPYRNPTLEEFKTAVDEVAFRQFVQENND
jgi:hypothetical protein